MFTNIVIGKPIVDVSVLLSTNQQDWETSEKQNTLFTESRFLPQILKEAGVVKSTGEVRRNKPEFVKTLDHPDFIFVKWGKKIITIVVGE